MSFVFSFVWLVSSTPCFLLFSFSLRRWGNPNLFGLGFPLCFRGHALAPRPVLRGRHLLPGHLPHLFFFFSDAVRLSGGGWSWLVVVALGLSLSLSLLSWWLCCAVSMNAVIRQREGVAYKTAPPIIIIIIVFWGLSTERCPGLSVLNRLCSPHLLPQSPKAGAGRGGGGAGRTVTQMLFWLGGPYCHAIASLICSVSKGEMLSVFFTLCFLCLVRCLLSLFFRSSLLRVVV